MKKKIYELTIKEAQEINGGADYLNYRGSNGLIYFGVACYNAGVMAASVLPLFIIGDGVPFYLSILSLFIITFGIPVIINSIRKCNVNIDYSYNFLKIIKGNKIVHLFIILYLILSITAQKYLHITGNENSNWDISLFGGAVVDQ